MTIWYRQMTSVFVPFFVPNIWNDTSDCRFIAVDRWDPVVFIVFDLFNIQYDHLDAHLDGKNELPVRVVRISQGDNRYLIKASEAQHIKYLSDEVRNLHESHGWEERVPFRIDHYNGAYPTYYHPRALRNENSGRNLGTPP
jgi:hypothetical protein